MGGGVAIVRLLFFALLLLRFKQPLRFYFWQDGQTD